MTIKVRDDYGEGGAGLNGPGAATAQHRPVSEVLRGLIDDIDAGDVGSIATIASADASDLATAITLVNEIKAALNAATAAATGAAKNVVKG
jgi:hypothetical protein